MVSHADHIVPHYSLSPMNDILRESPLRDIAQEAACLILVKVLENVALEEKKGITERCHTLRDRTNEAGNE